MFSRAIRPSTYTVVGVLGIMALMLLLSPILSLSAVLAYSATTQSTQGMYLFDTNHSINQPIVRDATTVIAQRAPDNAHFAYVQAFDDGTMQVVIAGIGGRSPQAIYPHDSLIGQVGTAPVWNADGTQLLFAFIPDDSEGFQLVRYTLATNNIQTYTLSDVLNDGQAPFVWMPDDTVRYVTVSSSRVRLMVLSLDTLNTAIVREWAFDTQLRLYPILAPDGERFVLPAAAAGSFNFEIYLFDTSTGIVTNISERPLHNDTTPVWSPDGQVVYFRATNDGGHFLIARSLEDSTGTIVFSHPIATLTGFVPTADGDFLAVVLNGVGQPDTLCIVNLINGHATCPIQADQIFNLSWWE